MTITATLYPANDNYIVIPQGFTVSAWSSNCHIGYQSTRPPVSDEVCHGRFHFTAIAPPKPTSSQTYPLLAGYWYGISRKPSLVQQPGAI